jgi:hypothetical protein
VGEVEGGANPIIIQTSYMASLAATAGLVAWAGRFRRRASHGRRARQDAIEMEGADR